MSKMRFVQVLVISAMVVVPAFTAFPASSTQAMSDVRQEASRAGGPSAVEGRGKAETKVSDAAPASYWEGRLVSETADYSLYGSVLRVSVEGKPGLPVKIYTEEGWNTTNYTSTKPEYGPFVAEFAPLQVGYYYIAPQGLGVEFRIYADAKSYIFVEFRMVEGTPTPAPTPTPTAPAPTPTPTPAIATLTPVPASTPVPPAVVTWTGQVVENTSGPIMDGLSASIAVVVHGAKDLPVTLKSDGWSAVARTGTKPDYGDYACEFGGLSPGTYTVIPQGMNVAVPVTMDGRGFARVEFVSHQEAVATPQMAWGGQVVSNTSGDQPGGVSSSVMVIVNGRQWLPVEIRSDGWSATAETGTKKDYGNFACEFGGLGAGTYTIIPQGLDTSLQVTMDGWGHAVVEFDTYVVQEPAPIPIPTSAPSGTTPGWSGRLANNTSTEVMGGASSVVMVTVVGMEHVQVRLDSGGWSAVNYTGTKPEYGDYACEFGGLWPGTYNIILEGLGTQFEVTMDGRGYAAVEFTSG